MSTAADNLQRAIEEMVTSKTLSLEAVEYVNRIKANCATLTDENEKLAGTLKSTQELARERAEIIDKMRETEKTIAARETAVALREKAVTELEKSTAVAKAESAVFEKCIGLVFRNAEVRSSMFGQAPTAANANPNQYQNPTVSVSEDRTVTRT